MEKYNFERFTRYRESKKQVMISVTMTEYEALQKIATKHKIKPSNVAAEIVSASLKEIKI